MPRGEIPEQKTDAHISGVWYTIARNTMTYNQQGKLITSENLAGQVTTTAWDCCFAYGYNNRSELTNAVAVVDSDYRYAYDFDDIGNRESSFERGTNSVYAANQLNQYTEISSSALSASPRETFTPQFDDDGNQTLIKTATGIWSVTYNGENRPILWENVSTNSPTPNPSTPTLISMSYDRIGRRVTKNAQRFVYDGYLQIANFELQTSDIKHHTFIWDPTEPVATRPLVWNSSTIQPFNFSTSYYTHDGNKNVSEVLASDGALAAHYEYAPFGAVVAQRGASVASNPWCFSSEYAEDDTATVYYNYRHYEPVMGRWLSRDPIGNIFSLNLFAFSFNQQYFDFLGLFTFDDFTGTPPEGNPHSALTACSYDIDSGCGESMLDQELSGEQCRDAKTDEDDNGNGSKVPRNSGDGGKKDCPCKKCYIYKARFPDFKITATFDPAKSWVKEYAKDDAELLAHENLHLIIDQKEAEKEAQKIRNKWVKGALCCDASKAQDSAEAALMAEFYSMSKAAYTNIDNVGVQYDQETEHGTNGDKQKEWQGKYN